MSCWVVPSLAAELWNVSIEQVLDDLHAGRISGKHEAGFTFVDVAPDSPTIAAAPRIRPPTYAVVTGEEIAALFDDEIEDETISIGDWRQSREDAATLRQPPLAA